MSKVMLINVTHVEESRVAVLENGVLDAYEIETINRANIKGNIYNAVVESIHPSLEAAFLKIAPDLKGFLPLDEVNFKLLPARGDSRKLGRIGQHLHPGQRLMAQVIREPFAGKPPTVSTYFSLPGRFLVLMPGVDSSGVSRKIDSPEQRERLKQIVDELRPPEGFGVIVRTAGVGQTKTELQRDMRYLLRLWQSIQRGGEAGDFPGLVYREADLVIRTIRDHFTPDISEVWVDSKDTYEKALEFVHDVMPTKARTIRLYSGDRPLFNKFNLEEQIETIYKRRVPLTSGGEIVIDGTEALTAVDVNSARSKRQGDAEDNAVQTNLEAAAEIARQLRLRDLGGLVVIDFIDMSATRNKKKVEKAMRDAMRGDKAKYDVTTISKLGLVEIARQRIKGAKMGAMYTACPACEGYGLVKNVEAAGLAALRKLQTRSARGDFGRLRMSLPPEAATWILNHKREDLLQLERRCQCRVDVLPEPRLLRHQVEIEILPREKTEEPAAVVRGDREVPVPPSEQELAEARRRDEPTAELAPPPPVEAPAAKDEAGRKRRRRRRRRGAGGLAETDVTPRAAEGRSDESDERDEPDAHGGAAVSHSRRAGASREPEAAPEPNVVPFARREAQERGNGVPPGEPISERAATDEENAASGGRRRRRRRRKRPTGEGRGDAASEARAPETRASETRAPETRASEARAPEARAHEDETVPSHVRVDELMPAAGRPRGRRGGRGRRRRTNGRPPGEGV